MSAETVRGWMDNYCQTHPLESIEQAGGALVRAHGLPAVPEVPTPAASNPDACESQIMDAYHLIDSNRPQMTATVMALEDMQCKGSPAACNTGANNRQKQIDANELEKSRETNTVLRAIGCFQQEPLTAPPSNDYMRPQTDLLDPGLPDHDP